MRRAAVLAALAVAAVQAAPAAAAPSAYRVDAGAKALQTLAAEGFDLTEARRGRSVEIVTTAGEAAKLRALGLKPGRARVAARAQRPDGSWDVFRPYHDATYAGTDAAGRPRPTLEQELRALAAANPDLVKLVEIGRSVRGVPILALKVTRDARRVADGRRPAVLYSAAQHAREWLTPEMDRRLLRHVLDAYGAPTTEGRRITGILATTELWFVPVANPDGYDHSFVPGNRLWRKNLRDNDANGRITIADGVDLNRNFPTNWRWDEEGSSGEPDDETYRGTAPASEPETRALDRLMRRIRFAFQINYHTYGPLILYPFGWQVETPSGDHPIFSALSGTDEEPAVAGYDPDVAAELYTTNGETTDHVYTRYGTLAWTVEMDAADPTRGGGPSGFQFQDSEADVQAAFEKNLPFALDVAESAKDPANPVSHLDTTVPDFEVAAFPLSFGDPQTVEANVRRALGEVEIRWSVNDGEVHGGRTAEWDGGERYGAAGDRYFHRVRGTVRGTSPGDRVRVWFVAGGTSSRSFTYTARSESGAPVLLLAAEDYTGEEPGPRPGPAYLPAHAEALRANGIAHDVYDVDAEGRTAPDPLGVLAHYDAVLWYTGDDLVVREPGMGAGTSKLADDEILAVRAYLNDGGKLVYAGQNAAYGQLNALPYNPAGQPPYCAPAGAVANCVPLSNDFLQYWLGAFFHADAATTKAAASALVLDPPGDAPRVALNGPDSADNQEHVATLLTTSSVLSPAEFPQFASEVFVRRGLPPAFDPPTGAWYAFAGSVDEGWQRLTRTIDLTGATRGELTFKLAFDTETDYDFVAVEARTVGAEDWTTLPDANGHTSTSVGKACDSNWDTIHSFLAHYQTNADPLADDCTATGTTGAWHAATGDSGGFQEWRIDLSAYAGKQVEVAIASIQDFNVDGLGVLLDDVVVAKDGAPAEATSFEDGLGGWAAGPPPPGSADHARWGRSEAVTYEDGPGVATDDTVYLSFGLEGVRGAAARAALVGEALGYLGVRGEAAARR